MRHLIQVFSCLLFCLSFHVTLQGQSCTDPAACNFDPNSGEPTSVCLDIESFAVHTEGNLAGLTTYRLYLQATDPTDFVTAVYGSQSEPLSLTTTTNFYHHPLGGASAEAVNPLLLGVYPELEYDSYVTIGLDRKAVSSAGENAASLIASPDQDWISVFDPGSGALGSDIVIDDEIGGIWFIYNGDSNGAAGTEERVLLAQLTTDGVLGGALNVQYFPAGGEASTVTFVLDTPCAPSNDDDCVYADPGLDCAGNCINDLDEDQICDEDDDCVGTPDALGVCNGSCTADINNNGICDDSEDCLGAPTLSSATPTSGLSCVGGELIQLSGTNLCDASVTVDGASVAVINGTPSQVSFSMPAGVGSASVLVTTPVGTSNALTLTYGTSGCLDPTACNFDATAECDGGGCLYLDAIGDCGGDCPADNDDNGICDNQEGSGCADDAACNFDPFAEPVDAEPISDYCLLTEVVMAHTSGDLAGMTTYQVSIQTLNNLDFVTSVSGNVDAPTTVATTTSFYQHILGGVTPQNVNPLLLGDFPNLAYDSWVTIGLDGPADANQGENSAGVVNSPGQNWGLAFDPGSGASGSDLIINDNVGGVWYILNGDANGFPDENGRVLLGQFTTDGVLSGRMQVQVFPNGDNGNFVLLDLPLGMGVGCTEVAGDCLYDDALGNCGGDCTADVDADGVCDDVDPCVGAVDACGVCNGPGAVYDCGCDPIAAGDCDCDGNEEDALGICGGDCTDDADEDGLCDDVDDCVGTLDACGICNGPGETGDCGCDDIPAGECDCNGNVLDAIGVCGGTCTVDADGDGLCDDEDPCVGELDACGVCNGPGAVYACGCDEIAQGACDCDGNVEDAIGVCGGNCSADVNNNGICDDTEEGGCDDEDACNYDANALPYTPPVVDEGYCLELRTVAEHTEGALAGQTTYQILLHTENTSDFVTSVYGNINEPLAIETSTSFFQHVLGGVTPENVNPLLLGNYPNLAFDSWITIGLDGPANASNGENGAATVQSPNQLWSTIFEPGSGAPGGNIVMDDEVGGVWYVLNGDANGMPSAEGTVLLGQFTTDGALTGNMNIQVFPEGDNENFVKVNLPIGGNCVAVSVNPACEYPDGDDSDCDGVCYNDADEDGVCDEQEVAGCQDQLACNYNPLATDDDGSCLALDACGECGGSGIPNGDCDCDGSVEDAIGDCGGDCEADADNDGICDDEDPCVGAIDACGICNGPGAIYDCGCEDIADGDCDCDGNVEDVIGNCGGDCTDDVDNDGICDDVDPCVGAVDACGVCNGPGAIYLCGCDAESCLGCTEPTACNFDASATQSDGSCIFPVGLLFDCNGDCVNDVDDNGVCDELEILGCTQAEACNYEPLATNNDGSCDFDSCKGCTLPSACNYDPQATQDDGSCDLLGCYGCTYADALNYDANATIDDGGCLYDGGSGNDDCPADFTGDDVIGIADLLEFLVYFDTSCISD